MTNARSHDISWKLASILLACLNEQLRIFLTAKEGTYV